MLGSFIGKKKEFIEIVAVLTLILICNGILHNFDLGRANWTTIPVFLPKSRPYSSTQLTKNSKITNNFFINMIYKSQINKIKIIYKHDY